MTPMPELPVYATEVRFYRDVLGIAYETGSRLRKLGVLTQFQVAQEQRFGITLVGPRYASIDAASDSLAWLPNFAELVCFFSLRTSLFGALSRTMSLGRIMHSSSD
jgi:hypothetical protein